MIELDIINDPKKYGYQEITSESDKHRTICIWLWHDIPRTPSQIENEVYHWIGDRHELEGIKVTSDFDYHIATEHMDIEKIIW